MSPIIILVGPQNKGNLGAVARVMSNFGLRELRVVGDLPTQDATEAFSQMDWGMACRGEDILKNAALFSTLQEAVADLSVCIGSSGKGEEYSLGYSRPFVSPEQAFHDVANDHNVKKWALVFGPESDGLGAEDISHCQQVIQIPCEENSPSINLAMACGLLIYHWKVISSSETRTDTETHFKAFELQKNESWSSQGEKEKFIEYLVDTLKLTQFFKYPDDKSVQGRFRRFFQSCPIPQGELLLAFEAIYQMRSWGLKKFEKRNFLSK